MAKAKLVPGAVVNLNKIYIYWLHYAVCTKKNNCDSVAGVIFPFQTEFVITLYILEIKLNEKKERKKERKNVKDIKMLKI